MENFDDVISFIESNDYFMYSFEIGERFANLFETLSAEQRAECEKKVRYEVSLFYLCAKNPIVDVSFKKRFEINEDSLDEEMLSYFEFRLENSSNIFLVSRYIDFIFEYSSRFSKKRNKFEIAKQLVPTFRELARRHANHHEPSLFGFIDSMARAVEVSIRMNLMDELGYCLETISEQLKILGDENIGLTIRLSKIVFVVAQGRFNAIVSSELVALVEKKFDDGRKYCLTNGDYSLHRLFCEEILKWSSILGLKEDKKMEYQMEIGKSFENESEHQQGRSEQSSIVKAHFLELALKHYANIGETAKVEEMKVRVRTAYDELKTSGELKEISTEFSIGRSEMDSMTQDFMMENVDESINILARNSVFIPDLVKVINETRESQKLAPLSFLMSQSILDDGKKVLQVGSDDDSFNFHVIQHYMIHLNMLNVVLLQEVFRRFTDELNMTANDILRKMKSWSLLHEDNIEFLEVGINRFFEGDYISSMHILVPQFESVVRRMFSQSGYATTSIKTGTAQHEQTFNDFLRREEIKSALGENFHKMIEVVMVEQAGYNLRNKIAHGLIRPSEVNKVKNILIIYMFLFLTNYGISSS